MLAKTPPVFTSSVVAWNRDQSEASTCKLGGPRDMVPAIRREVPADNNAVDSHCRYLKFLSNLFTIIFEIFPRVFRDFFSAGKTMQLRWDSTYESLD